MENEILQQILSEIKEVKSDIGDLKQGQAKLEQGQAKLEQAVKDVDDKFELYFREMLKDMGRLEDRLKKIEPVAMDY